MSRIEARLRRLIADVRRWGVQMAKEDFPRQAASEITRLEGMAEILEMCGYRDIARLAEDAIQAIRDTMAACYRRALGKEASQ